MTTDERIAALAAEVERLKARDARRESEHIHMLETRREVEEKVRDEHARDYNMLAKAGDDRFAEAKGTITEMADVVNIGIHNEKVLVKGQQLLARQVDEHTQALNALGARMAAVEASVSTVDQIAKDLRGMHAKIEELYERFSAGRANRRKDPSSN